MKLIQEKLPKPIAEAMAKQDTFVRALFSRPESLSALLPYDDYIPETGIFRNRDGSLGVVFEAALLEHEPMDAEQIVSTVESLKSWFDLPANCTLQILYDQSYVSALDPAFTEIDRYFESPNPVSKLLFERRMKEIREACNSSHPLAPLARRAFVSIRYYPMSKGSGLSRDFVRGAESILFTEMKWFIQESRAFSQIVSNYQDNSRVPLRQLKAQELLDVLRRFFNPKTYYKRSFAKYNPNLPISDQLIYNTPTLDHAGIEREGVKTRTLTLKTSPQYAYPGGMAYFTQLRFPFKLALNLSFPTKRQVKTFFDMKEFFLQNTPSAKARRQREEILEVQERLARDDRCLHATINVIVEGATDDELDERVRSVVNVFHNNLECETILEDDIGLGLCLNALPLNYIAKSDYSSQRFIRILRSDAVNFLPVFNSFQGMKKPVGVYLSRENNLVRFSLLENETSNHTVVLADSGSGKSAFIIDCIQSVKRMSPEPLVFVVDKKSSSVMLSEYFDGELTVFDRNKEIPFSPFRGNYDEDKFAFLTKLLGTAIRLTSPDFKFDSMHETVIGKALRLAYERRLQEAGFAWVDGDILKGHHTDEEIERKTQLVMDNVIFALSSVTSEKGFESFGQQVDEVAQRLMSFHGEGQYAKYFSGTSQARGDRKSLLYVYDLDSLDTDPVLQALMTMAVFEEIRCTMKSPENQGRTAFLILEELGMLGRNNPTAGPFIIDFAETSRKLGLWLISATPRPSNYVELEAGRAMWSVADNFVFLQMSADNIRYLKSQSKLLDEATVEIIESLRTVKGSHADVYFMNKKKTRCGAFRYVQTPLDRWLAPTNSKDANAAAKALKKFKGARWQALEFLAEKYPQGVERHEEQTNQERMKLNEE